jgi:transcriptional regulator with XRE-family HTH domain
MKGNIAPEQLQQARLIVGNWLKNKRVGKRLSQAALGRLMAIDPATINKIESGKWAITIDMLALFCEHLECPLDAIFTIDHNQEL